MGINRPGNAAISEISVASLVAIAMFTLTCGESIGITLASL